MKELKSMLKGMGLLVGIVIALEIVLRCFYFQTVGTKPTAIGLYYDKVSHTVDVKDTMRRLLTFQPLDPDHYKKFYNDQEYATERDQIFTKYEKIFIAFKQLANDAGTSLLMLYIPKQTEGNPYVKEYYENLASHENVPYLNASLAFSRADTTNIYEENGLNILSAYGHQVLAKYLYEKIARYLNFKNKISFTTRPNLLGDLNPATDSLWGERPEDRYRVITNSQGLRRARDVTFPRPAQQKRIVCIGGTMTFGPFVDNGKTYTDLLENSLDNVAVINAGVMNYTICDEYSYFKVKGQYLEPDIVVLQVTDDDLYALYPHEQKKHCRGGSYCIR
ncbi:MAG: hypothetical protein JW938_06055 [Candidatus Omnitrophica bacterium]|nr:hypothetical protein [Candidatus Omnitrophota bacterium]